MWIRTVILLALFVVAATAAHGSDEHLAPNPPIDPDCPYLTVEVLTPSSGHDPDERRVWNEIQKPYMEKFSAQLEQVGFKVWEPFWARMEREGFTELGAWWARLLEINLATLDAREEVELEEIMAKLTAQDRARAEQIKEEAELATWNVESIVMDLRGLAPMGRPKRDRTLVWSWIMNKRPTVLDGALRIDAFKDPRDDNPRRLVTGINDLWFMAESDFGVQAAAAADQAAALFLPHARQLCADMNATLLQEEAELERIREQLTEEIIRIRERRAEKEKQLKIEVEQ